MGLFPETIARQLGGGKVKCAPLVKFDFASEPMRLWRGNGVLRTKDDARWKAIGQWGGMSGIEQAINGAAPEANFTLSGVDADIQRLARDEFEAEVLDRLVIVYAQFFGVEDEADPDNDRPLDLPYPIWGARMLQPTFALDRRSGERTITVSAESLFSLRSRPRHAMYTDSDQRHRYPDAGDKGFEFVATLINKVLTWPDY